MFFAALVVLLVACSAAPMNETLAGTMDETAMGDSLAGTMNGTLAGAMKETAAARIETRAGTSIIVCSFF